MSSDAAEDARRAALGALQQAPGWADVLIPWNGQAGRSRLAARGVEPSVVSATAAAWRAQEPSDSSPPSDEAEPGQPSGPQRLSQPIPVSRSDGQDSPEEARPPKTLSTPPQPTASTRSMEPSRSVLRPPDVSRETSVSETDDTPLARAAATAVQVRSGLAGDLQRPRDTRVIAVTNQKGGVGKTTSTVNLAAALAVQGLRVLVIDLDPQGNASTALSVEHHLDVRSSYDVLVGGVGLADVVVQVPDIAGLWCVPATLDLAGAEIELVSRVAREHLLRKAIAAFLDDHTRLHGRLDYVLIDCPPSLGLITVNALVAAQEVLIPIQCEYYALEGLGQLLRTVDLVRENLSPQLYVSTILLTMYDARTRLAAQVADEVRRHFGDKVLPTVIPRSVRLSEAPSYGQTIMTYDPGSSGALSYLEASRELNRLADRGSER